MSQLSAKARALCAGAAIALLAVLAVMLLAVVLDRAGSRAQGDPAPAHVGGLVTMRIPGAGQLLVALPRGWGIIRTSPGSLTLASPGTCHTATLLAFVDHAAERPEDRAIHLLGNLVGREFDLQRLWRGTTANGRGYAAYDPLSLAGVEAVRRRRHGVVMVIHGLPTHARCSAHDAAAPRWELSRLLQDLRVLEPAGAGPRQTA
jgi:hypothetical protein